MILVNVEGTTIEKALKTLKRKWDKTKTLRELRDRKEFTKRSVKRRAEINKAKYVQDKYRNND